MIIVMEMTDGHSMVLSLMACALLASLVARMISRPLYSTMALLMMRSLRGEPAGDTHSGQVPLAPPPRSASAPD